MSDENGAPGAGSEAAPVVAPANLDSGDSYSPEQAHEAYLKRINPSAESAESAPAETQSADEADADPVAEQAPGEEPEDAEPANEPPIEPPRSWTKEAKDRWNALPREAQEEFARIEQSREREFRRSQNETAAERKAVQAEREQVAQARQEYEAKLPAIMQALHDVNAAQFSDIKSMDDVVRMAAEDPFRKIQWDAHQQRMQAVQWEAQQAETRKTQEQQTEWTNLVRKENMLFAERVPEFADPTKAKDFQSKAAPFLTDVVGFTDQELGELAQGKSKIPVYDHRFQLLVLDAMKWSDAQKAKATVLAKPVPAVQRPGVSPGKGAIAAENVQAIRNKLAGSGSVEDAFALYQAKQRRRAT